MQTAADHTLCVKRAQAPRRRRTVALLWVVALPLAAASGCREGSLSGLNGAEFDAGVVLVSPQEAARVEHTFDVPNPYDHPLRIRVASRSCGCTQARLDREVVAPGETAQLHLSVSVANENQDRTVQATVDTDSEERPSLQFVVNWTTRARVSSNARDMVRMPVKPEGESSQMVSFSCLQPLTEAPQELRVRSRDHRVETRVLRVDQEPDQDGLRSWRVETELRAGPCELSQHLAEVVWIEATYGGHVLQLPVLLQPVREITPIPQQVFLRRNNDVLSADFRLSSGSEFRILDIASASSEFELLSRFSDTAQTTHAVSITIPNVMPPGGLLETVAVIHTDHPKQREVRLPVYAYGAGRSEAGE